MGPGQTRGAEELLLVRGKRREARLSASAASANLT